MLTESASSSHRSDRVQKNETRPAISTAVTATTVARLGRPGESTVAVVSRAGASESTVMGPEGNTGPASHPDAATARRSPARPLWSARDARDHVTRERFEAVRRRCIPEPEHELATAGIDELLHLLTDLLGGSDEVVTHVLVVR